MLALDLLLIPLFLGLVGFVTPCSLAVNLIFLGYIRGKPRAVRLTQGAIFTLIRALILMILGLLFGYIGQAVVGFQFAYRPIIAVVFIAAGVLFLVSRKWPLPLPDLGFVRNFGRSKQSAVALGTLFGLDIPACSTPLLLYLLGKTVLKGDMVFGAISLLFFGIGMSLPLLGIAAFEGANRFLERATRTSGPLAYTGGVLLILLGLAAFSPKAMASAGVLFNFMVQLFVT
jgi:cytochrome c-type biogenesis protein